VAENPSVDDKRTIISVRSIQQYITRENTLDSYAADVGRRLDEILQQAYEHTASVAPAPLRDVERSRSKRYPSVSVDADDLDLI
jgi:hypothetical protein